MALLPLVTACAATPASDPCPGLTPLQYGPTDPDVISDRLAIWMEQYRVWYAEHCQ